MCHKQIILEVVVSGIDVRVPMCPYPDYKFVEEDYVS